MGRPIFWGFDEHGDDMARTAVLLIRTSGIPTIDGTHYFRHMELQPHGWHVAKTDANAALMVTMIEEARNALYSVFPHGCYAKVLRLTSDDALLHGLPPMVAASASPPQGGMPASSSGAISVLHRKVGCQLRRP